MWKSVSAFVFNEWFWLPPNVTWESFAITPSTLVNGEPTYYPRVPDLLWAFPIALFIIPLRFFVERYVAVPLGLWLGLRPSRTPPPLTPNTQLELAFRKSHRPDADVVAALSKQTELATRAIERWFRRRRAQLRAGTLRKFTESFWKFCFYTVAWLYGLYAMSDKPWLYSPGASTWENAPYQHVPSEIYYYYLLETSFYMALSATFFTDISRKDWREMALHHVVTLSLLWLSWWLNWVRIGSLVLVSHDVADVFLELLKMSAYLELPVGRYVAYGLLLGVWVLSRLLYYPVCVVYPCVFGYPASGGSMYPVYWIIIPMLVALLVLHVYWFWLIVQVALNHFLRGKTGDVRSDTEESEHESESEESPNGQLKPQQTESELRSNGTTAGTPHDPQRQTSGGLVRERVGIASRASTH